MKRKRPDNPAEDFIAWTKSSKKYRTICEDTIRDVIQTALPRYKNAKEAAKAARTKLHRIQAAYLGTLDIEKSLPELRTAVQEGDESEIKNISLQLMQGHASTRERLEVLDGFYEKVFSITGKPQTVLDVACGVHPLGLPWMALPTSTVYYGYEISLEMVQSLNLFVEALGYRPLILFQDVICTPPQEEGDLAFLMKMVPCLERREKGIAANLMHNLKVRYIVVTFPIKSLSGRSKHMPGFYSKMFEEMINPYGWPLTRVDIEDELVFVVDKGP